VDVWLPDFKYSDDELAMSLSRAPEYSRCALDSLKEMVHQAGTTLHTDHCGIARRGTIIRHLVLPGFIDNSIGVLQMIAENLSPNLHISLMSQYYPPDNPSFTYTFPEKEGKFRKSQIANLSLQQRKSPGLEASGKVFNPAPSPVPMKSGMSVRNSLHRPLTRTEYETVVDAFHSLGFTRGWLQDYESHRNYRPDFSKDHPFE
jgi:putative pyruvate formate lyase activating enzyme